jgi:hypothetical protein
VARIRAHVGQFHCRAPLDSRVIFVRTHKKSDDARATSAQSREWLSGNFARILANFTHVRTQGSFSAR